MQAPADVVNLVFSIVEKSEVILKMVGRRLGFWSRELDGRRSSTRNGLEVSMGAGSMMEVKAWIGGLVSDDGVMVQDSFMVGRKVI